MMRTLCYMYKYTHVPLKEKLDPAFCLKQNTVDSVDVTSKITLGKSDAPFLVAPHLHYLCFHQANCHGRQL